ncbi:unnamed protein product [Enterobius vermicularis]|uniref:C2H2-type domain-containing protein n=1 Tax=Enterobius vermicularis TaxID=51028 RepID=A0A0N4V662_ENTVE|nr:unnamed protein product [Enterobius vermicularis]
MFKATSNKVNAKLPGENETTYPCSNCGRRFIQASLAKHEPVCKKIGKKRKVFDSGKQRATGSDITLQNVRKAERERQLVGGVFPRPQTSWRERHESFVSAVSTSRQVDYNTHKNSASPPIPRTSVPKDYVRCDYCGRNFNQQAAERHIPFCRDQHSKKGPIRVTSHSRPFSVKQNGTNINERSATETRQTTRSRADSAQRSRSTQSKTPATENAPQNKAEYDRQSVGTSHHSSHSQSRTSAGR